MRTQLILIFVIWLQACDSNQKNLFILQTCANDSLYQGESFKETYLKFRHSLRDSLLGRIAFPFSLTRKLDNRDWATEQFPNMESFQKFQFYNETIKALREKLPYDERYNIIFANSTTSSHQLKIISTKESIGFRFVSKNGVWYLTEFVESLVEF